MTTLMNKMEGAIDVADRLTRALKSITDSEALTSKRLANELVLRQALHSGHQKTVQIVLEQKKKAEEHHRTTSLELNALKEEAERQRTTHSKQLEEETGALKKELESVKAGLETRLADVTQKAKDAAAKANSESTEMITKIALLEQQSKLRDKEKSHL